MHCRRHDKTGIFANINPIGQRLAVPIRKSCRSNAEVQINHASAKHAQTIGTLERTYASIKTALKISTGEKRSMWHKNAQIAVMNYNTTYLESLGCEPSIVFHARIPYNILDLKLAIKPKWKTTPNSDIVEPIQKQNDEVHETAKDNIMLSYLNYKKIYNR